MDYYYTADLLHTCFAVKIYRRQKNREGEGAENPVNTANRFQKAGGLIKSAKKNGKMKPMVGAHERYHCRTYV